MNYKFVNCHSSLHLRRETAATGPSFLAAARNSAWPDYRFQDIDPNLFFLPLARRGLKGHPCKVLQGASHRLRWEWFFSVRAEKYRYRLQASVVTTHSVKIFKKRLENVWTQAFPHLPHWLNTHLSISLPRPLPTCTRPITSYHLYMLPNTLFCLCGFFRAVVAYCLPL